jgi:N-methylhydantoinase A/oxoprolinase/acetone carboxylase beta subunit
MRAKLQESLVKAAVPLGSASFLIHGSTVVVNAIIERKRAKAALVTTQGCRDVALWLGPDGPRTGSKTRSAHRASTPAGAPGAKDGAE